jgi:hypothetical protein
MIRNLPGKNAPPQPKKKASPKKKEEPAPVQIASIT